MTKRIDAAIKKLKAALGEEHVKTGQPVDRAVVEALGTSLGVKLPADYIAFVMKYGFLLGGDSGRVTVFGVAPKGTRLPYTVGLAQATKQLHRELRDRMKRAPDSREPLEPGLSTIPIIGWAEDFPHHTVHVFDAEGKLCWFLVKEWALDPPGATFTSYLEELVEREVASVAEERAASARQAKADTYAFKDDYTQIWRASQKVLGAIRKYPQVIPLLHSSPTRKELESVIAPRSGWGLSAADKKRVKAFIAELGKTATYLRAVDELGNGNFEGPAIRFLLCGRAERPDVPTTELEQALNGEELVATGLPEHPYARLVSPARVEVIAPALRKAQKRITKDFDAKRLRKAGVERSEYVATDQDWREHLASHVADFAAVYDAAAAAGDGVYVQSRYL